MVEVDRLPELPDSECQRYEWEKDGLTWVSYSIWHVPNGMSSFRAVDLYTAEQVREVATEAIAAERAEVVRLRAEIEKLLLSDKEQHDLFMGQAVERAARDLPEGYELTINLERGAGWVEWTNDQGNTMGIESDGEPFHQQINSAIEFAIKEAGNGDD
jgi:hypothetical protein